jgi:hypothetical protein
MKAGQTQRAREVLSKLAATKAEADATFDEILHSIQKDEAKAEDPWTHLLQGGGRIRRMLVVVTVVAAAQPLCGIDGVMGYMVFMLKEAGLHSQGV